MLPREVVNKIVSEEQSDRYYKSFNTWDELVSLLFGVFTRCDSAREVCDCMSALAGKLNYLGMDQAPAKSTFNDGLNNRSEEVFEKIYFALIDYFSPLFSTVQDYSLNGCSPAEPFSASSCAVKIVFNKVWNK